MKRVLFFDRDGTIIVEPPEDFQVDSLEKLEFLPKAIRNLYQIKQQFNFEWVMVTNQDGLGTSSFPEETFWPAQEKMLKTLANEDIHFDDILIDRSFPKENLPTRKPEIGMLTKYLEQDYDLAHSYVIGDRVSDMELAKNLGAKGIFFSEENYADAVFCSKDWDQIFQFLKSQVRFAKVVRKTKETDISIELNLEGTGKHQIETGLGFFDHMLEQFALHSSCDLMIKTKGDLHIDEHHTIEDTALALGEAFLKALGDKRGLERYGFLLPMDDALTQVAIDFSGRPWLVWKAEFRREKIGEMPTEMFFHFFKSFCDTARCNLNIQAEGENEHHKIEAIFKGVARAIRKALTQHSSLQLPTTKGVL